MRSNINGFSLIELLIVVILISTLATAYLNFHDSFVTPKPDSVLSPVDSARYAILDEIAMDLRMAHNAPYEKSCPMTIVHTGETDIVKIRHDDSHNDYLVDRQGRLVCLTDKNQKILGDEVVSLKAREMGQGTIILTITALLPGDTLTSGASMHSYSKVVAVNFSLQNESEKTKWSGR